MLDVNSADAAPLHQRLHRRTTVPPADYRAVLGAIGAHVPDRRGHFGPAPEREVDWLAQLVAGRAVDGRLALALRETRRSVALMRALAATQRPEAATSLLRFAYRHEGAFRDECGRLLRQMGGHAIPALIRAQVLDDPLAFKMRRYAAYQLDRMNRSRPELALKQSDPRLVVEILHAYGEARQTSAVNAVLERTADPAPTIRRAARWAMLRFVTGRPPEAVQRHLRLPGGRLTEDKVDAYLTYQQLARQLLASRLAELLAKREGAAGSAAARRKQLLAEEDGRSLAAQLFAAYDAVRAQHQRARLERARGLAAEGQLEQATAEFDRLLAAEPLHPEAHLMAPAFRDQALRLLEREDYDQAVLLFAKAIALASSAARPTADEARALRTLRALRATAEALRDAQRGLSPTWRLEEARALAPQLALVRDTHRRFVAGPRRRALLAGGVAGGLILSLLALALRRRRRDRSAARGPTLPPPGSRHTP